MRLFISGCVVALLTAGTIQAELITNGTFETPVAPSGSGWQGFAAGATGLTGWTVGTVSGASHAAAQSVQIINAAISVSNGFPTDGTQVLQLGSYDAVSQTLATVSGLAYTISIDIAARDLPTSGGETISILFGGTTQTYTLTNKTTFATYTFTATATSASTLFEVDDTTFYSTSTSANRILIDNVSVTLVPEPGTTALLTAGVLGLICFAWRKRRKQFALDSGQERHEQ
jgi:hypothetical protein